MIIVKIELKSARGGKRDRILGVMIISNDGTGTVKLGNYRYTLSHAGIHFGKKKEPYKRGTIKGFRRSSSPYRLIQRCLKDAGEI
jgi:hypothetical protein